MALSRRLLGTTFILLCTTGLTLATSDYTIVEAGSSTKLEISPVKNNNALAMATIGHIGKYITKTISKTNNKKSSHKKSSKNIKQNGHRKIVYLTFDDGPVNGTENVIQVIKEEEIKATMFFIGRHVKKRQGIYNKAKSTANLLVANHTYAHANGKYARFYNSSAEFINKDINKAQELIGGDKVLRLAGRNVWRLSGISKNDYAIKKKFREREKAKYDALADEGYNIYGWDAEWRYASSTGKPSGTSAQMATKIESKYSQGSTAKMHKVIVLMHDFMFRTQTAKRKLTTLIQTLKADGWEFDTVNHYSDPGHNSGTTKDKEFIQIDNLSNINTKPISNNESTNSIVNLSF